MKKPPTDANILKQGAPWNKLVIAPYILCPNK